MNNIIHAEGNQVSRATVEDDKLYVHTVFNDDASLKKNAAIRDENLMDRHTLGLHDDADTRMAISCPSTLQWGLFKKKHADIYKLITTVGQGDEANELRIRGARLLEILHPTWVVFSRL